VVCSTCYWVGTPKKVIKGSFWIELILWLVFVPAVLYLWLAFIIPLIYSLWRLTSKYQACPQCGTPNMIPEDTPRGRELLQKIAPPLAPAPVFCLACNEPNEAGTVYCKECGARLEKV
jgi:hypothetical protein